MLAIAAHLALIIGRLGTAVSGFLAQQGRAPRVVLLGTRFFVEEVRPNLHRPIPAATWALLLRRVERLAERFQSLVARWHDGTLRPPRTPTTPAPRPQRAPYARLPRERGWINRRVAAAASCAGNLHGLLQRPEMAGFLAEVPRAGRLLRPLCHALAIDPPAFLRLPPRPRPPRVRRAPPRPPAFGRLPTDRPLEPYVRAAARAWKKSGT